MPVSLIEFYDKSPLENVVCSLAIKPGKVIYICSNTKLVERELERFRHLMKLKGIVLEMECRPIKKNNLDQIQETLLQIAEENPKCIIDLTGGDELSLVAVGTVAQILKDRNIAFHRINLNTRKMIDFFQSDPIDSICEPILSVAENIALYGGTIVYDDAKSGTTYPWNWTEDFKEDIHALWGIVRQDPGKWNAQIRQLESIINPTSTDVFCDVGYQDINGEPIRLWNRKLFHELSNAKLISKFATDNGTFSFTIKNTQISRVLSKAGTILELKTFLIAQDLQHKKQPYFSDVMTGVAIDWDGEVHQSGEGVMDTENEIDVLCMKGLMPLFISCKNGLVDESELYKLNTVAQRFGGDYARKVLIATYINKTPRQLEYFRQRAQDMDIKLIENVNTLEDKDFGKQLKILFT